MSFDPWERARLGRAREEVMHPGPGSAEAGRLCLAMPDDRAPGSRAGA